MLFSSLRGIVPGVISLSNQHCIYSYVPVCFSVLGPGGADAELPETAAAHHQQ